MANSSDFSGIRAVLWPIHNKELKKFIPMALMMFCILFNYSLLRVNKDSMIITECGAEIISALKFWAVLPSAVIFMIVYSKLANILSKPSLFYTISMFFLGFFAIFGFILYPLGDTLYINVDGAITAFPFLKWIFKMISVWPLTLFYIMSELWGSVMLSLMFWQFANQITPVLQAKRFYAMFGLIGNVSLMATGELCSKIRGYDDVTANYIISISLLVFGFLAVFAYSWINRNVLTDPEQYNPSEITQKKKKAKLSIGESFKYIFTSKYIGYIALLVICYGISINLIEGVWKDQVKHLYPNKADYRAFMGNLQFWTGVGTIICMIIGANILRVFGWTIGALATPVMVLVTGGLFLLLVVFQSSSFIVGMVGENILHFAVIMGLLQNVLAKSTKYSLFDSTKEMSYIPLDDELKSKGKAAVDVVGGRLGKSGGAAIQFLLLMIPGASLTSLAPTLAIICVAIILIWLWAVLALRKEFTAKTGGVADKQ